MKIEKLQRQREQGSALVACLVLMLIIITAVASLTSYVTQTVRLADRRSSATAALQFAQGGAVIAANDLNTALTNTASGILNNLATATPAYTERTDLNTANEKVYARTITTPFSNQVVSVQIWMTNSESPSVARIIATATVRDVVQTVVLHVRISFGFGAAIISDNPGSTSTGVSKSVAQDGNVVVSGGNSGETIIDGGDGLAIWANGRANVDANADVPASAVLSRAYGTANSIPDYTVDGSSDQLFDFKRFIAVADVAGTHYTTLTNFIAANNAASVSAAGALEGVIVVDIASDKAPGFGDLDPAHLPNGINVRGTLLFNFSSAFGPFDKIINTATVNINKADLSGLNPSDPSTYTTGYPPTYYNSAKNPINVDITSKGFLNFTPGEDLPAFMYNVGIFDIHGNANICGVVYSPSFMEIENKQGGQIQYFKGALIGGGGVYVDNNQNATSIVSYDPPALDLLATAARKGKRVIATYWE